ncbi:MAG TPA: nucleotidyltransferase substrate binding protein [bacterium]|nr:nucleotidyltransferase substrate binding protein [bacterium]
MKPKDIRWQQRFQNFKKAFAQLEQAVALKTPDIIQQQGIVQCFEYNFELSWKTLQDFLSTERGYSDIKGPRPVLEQAFQDGILRDGVTWLDMLKSRNLTAHLYDEEEVLQILKKIREDYFPLFSELKLFFEKHHDR